MTAATAGHFAKKLSKEQAAKIREQFDAADVNKDGYLSKEELKNLLASLGSNVDAQAILDSVDINNDGKLDFNEFIKAASAGHFTKKLSKEQAAKIQVQFVAADVNKDGFLSKDELKTLLSSLGNEVDVSSFLNSVDVNNDGKLDFNEFMTAATAGHFDKKLSKEQAAKLREEFDTADLNKDGLLSKDELKSLLNSVGGGIDV